MSTVRLSQDEITTLRKLVKVGTEILKRVDSAEKKPENRASEIRRVANGSKKEAVAYFMDKIGKNRRTP